MAKIAYRTWVDDETVTATMLNQQIRDNGNEIWKGSVAGDMDYYQDATHKVRLPIGNPGDIMQMVSGIPSWKGFSGCITIVANPVSVNNDTATAVQFSNGALIDTDGYYTNSTTFTVPANGIYAVYAYVMFASHASAGTLRELSTNTDYAISTRRGSIANTSMYMAIQGIGYMEQGDTTSANVKQKSGGALNVTGIYHSIVRIK